MPGPFFRRGGRPGFHRRSLRGRLARAFVLVALVTLGAAFIALGAGPTAERHMYPWRFRVIFPAVAVAAATGVLTARRIIRPLTRLEQAVERIGLNDLSMRAPVEGDWEVAALAQAFNRMAGRLEAQERVRRQLFADVAHELRHPLAVLKGRLDLMQDGVVALDPEQVLHLQDMVISLGRLVGDLRDLSLAEVGSLSLNLAPVDMGALIADLVENMEPVATEKQIALVADVAPGMPPVTADADRIGQVLVNLLANALQYTPLGGRVDVRSWAEGAQLAIQVRDTGPGIAPADLPHVFDRFYRADKARTRTTGGSGLGLAIVNSLVRLHGGTVAAESELGKGSCFTVRLPLRRDG
jgi:two-component system, OmpR family, sensor histidine kinase BaeS